MARRLNTTVHVHVDGASRVYGPTDEVPDTVATLITTPGVWADERDDADQPDEADNAEGTDEAEATDEVPDTAEGTDEAEATDEVPDTAEGVPPKQGKGSGVTAWRAYADTKGFETDDDISREEIIAALDAAGIPTE